MTLKTIENTVRNDRKQNENNKKTGQKLICFFDKRKTRFLGLFDSMDRYAPHKVRVIYGDLFLLCKVFFTYLFNFSKNPFAESE